jgi:hypothetical protein
VLGTQAESELRVTPEDGFESAEKCFYRRAIGMMDQSFRRPAIASRTAFKVCRQGAQALYAALLGIGSASKLELMPQATYCYVALSSDIISW